MVERYCVICGAEIPKPAHQKTNVKRYCGPECRKVAANESAARYKQRKLGEISAQTVANREAKLEACMKEAERLRISYGQYMARRG